MSAGKLVCVSKFLMALGSTSRAVLKSRFFYLYINRLCFVYWVFLEQKACFRKTTYWCFSFPWNIYMLQMAFNVFTWIDLHSGKEPYLLMRRWTCPFYFLFTLHFHLTFSRNKITFACFSRDVLFQLKAWIKYYSSVSRKCIPKYTLVLLFD